MTTQTFAPTGGYQFFTVPANVYSVDVDCKGAGSHTRAGGRTTGTLVVTPGQVLCLLVGVDGKQAVGTVAGAGGWPSGNGGGNGKIHSGGDGGGGYSAIRLTNSAGKLLCVAGGAAGQSGDAGVAGWGGGTNGGTGTIGTGGGNNFVEASGGTQTQAGHHGVWNGNLATAGTDGQDGVVGGAGHGATVPSTAAAGVGGGGGGGGYFPGGGGNAGITGQAGGGAGGGGSGFLGSLISGTMTGGGGNFTGGAIILTYSTSGGVGSPNAPSISTPTDGQRLKANSVIVNGTVSSSYDAQLRLQANLHKVDPVSGVTSLVGTYYSSYVAFHNGDVPKPLMVTVPLSPATQYILDIHTQDGNGVASLNYAAIGFFSNYPPNAPDLGNPPDNATFDFNDTISFSWAVNDDDGEPSGGSNLQFTDVTSGAVSTVIIGGGVLAYSTAASQFNVNQYTRWTVRTEDPEGNWGPYAVPQSFTVIGVASSPKLISPTNSSGLDVTVPETFIWQFRDLIGSNFQVRADFQYRLAGDSNDADWIILLDVATTDPQCVIPAGTFQADLDYEWEVRTYDNSSGGAAPSAWSVPNTFHAIQSVGGKAGDLLPTSDKFAGTLGCGDNKAYLFLKGGTTYLGALTPTSSITWGRSRDDISTCTIRVELTTDMSCCSLLEQIRSWQHEIVIYRDDGQGRNSRVWEGPITRIEYGDGYVELEARDVMVWVYRRILKVGYNDSYPRNRTVVFRAARIIIDALARDDPNILPYLTQFNFADDALESRVVPDYATTAWEEVDDMAAKAGLDYTTVGRRIVLFDTHRPIGKLPVMRSRDFSNAPVVTEYGMNLATEYAVSNGAGLYGTATRDNSFYGPVELLVSSYGDTAAGPQETLTAVSTAALITSLNSQASRGISDRWPTPLVVRVPDNSNIQPDAPFTIDQLIPGVWIPLQATHVCREFSQWQKLDSMTVTQDSSGESVAVVLSPAPNAGDDPDAGDQTDGGGT